jgi:hypothetical protein
MIKTDSLTQVLKSLAQRKVGARALMDKLHLLETGTGSQRNGVLMELKDFLIESQFGQNADLHRLSQFIQYCHQPEYEDTLGRDATHDLQHLVVGIGVQQQELKRISMVHAAGTQPKGWVEAQLRMLVSTLGEVGSFGRGMIEKLNG